MSEFHYRLNPSRSAPRTGRFWFIDLRGQDGNAFVILGTVAAIVRGTLGKDEERRYLEAAKAGDYQHLLDVTMEYVELREFDNSAMIGVIE